MGFTVIIPARYASTRLPGKPLLEINGKTLLQHVYESACSSKARRIIIATEDKRVLQTAIDIGAEAILTAAHHRSGTERVAEVVTRFKLPENEIIVNVQGDEFGLPAALIDQVAELLPKNSTTQIASLCEPLQDTAAVQDPNVVKVIMAKDGSALYFSRAPVPWQKNPTAPWYRHIGLYAFYAHTLREFITLPATILEQLESLEQLRALYHGWKISLAIVCKAAGNGVDTPGDLENCRLQAIRENS